MSVPSPTTDQNNHNGSGGNRCQASVRTGDCVAFSHGITGTEWVVDALGCNEVVLRDADRVKALLDEVVSDLGLNVIGKPMIHIFPGPGGVTLLYLLSESHLAAHTYPEYQTATFNLYCCRDRPAWAWDAKLREWLMADHVTVRRFDRGRRTEVVASAQERKPEC